MMTSSILLIRALTAFCSVNIKVHLTTPVVVEPESRFFGSRHSYWAQNKVSNSGMRVVLHIYRDYQLGSTSLEDHRELQ